MAGLVSISELDLLLSDEPCINYISLITLIGKAIKTAWGDTAIFVAAYPKEIVDKTPIITHQVMSKVPASLGTNATREIKPRLRYQGKTDDGRNFKIMGQFFEYSIRFDIWANNGEQADEYVENFQALMCRYTGKLKKSGVSEILFSQQINDEVTNKWRAELINRTLIYYVRLDETITVIVDDIESIDLRIKIMHIIDQMYDNSNFLPDYTVRHVTTSGNDDT